MTAFTSPQWKQNNFILKWIKWRERKLGATTQQKEQYYHPHDQVLFQTGQYWKQNKTRLQFNSASRQEQSKTNSRCIVQLLHQNKASRHTHTYPPEKYRLSFPVIPLLQKHITLENESPKQIRYVSNVHPYVPKRPSCRNDFMIRRC